MDKQEAAAMPVPLYIVTQLNKTESQRVMKKTGRDILLCANHAMFAWKRVLFTICVALASFSRGMCFCRFIYLRKGVFNDNELHI